MGSYRSVDLYLNSGVTLSTDAIQIGEYEKLCIEFPTFTSGGTHYINGSSDNSTYRRLAVIDSSGDAASIEIGQAVSGFVEVPYFPGVKYLKMENTSGTTDTVNTYIVHFK